MATITSRESDLESTPVQPYMTINMVTLSEQWYAGSMSAPMSYRTISAGEFKAKCLKLMDEVNETGVPLVITKRGRPVSRLMPAGFEPRGIRGRYKGLIAVVDNPDEGAYTEDEWDQIMDEWADNQQWWLNPAPHEQASS